MRSRTIAIAGSIAALSFAAVPIAQAVPTNHAHHTPAVESRIDRSRDATGVRHTDKIADPRGGDTSRDNPRNADTSRDLHDR